MNSNFTGGRSLRDSLTILQQNVIKSSIQSNGINRSGSSRNGGAEKEKSLHENQDDNDVSVSPAPAPITTKTNTTETRKRKRICSNDNDDDNSNDIHSSNSENISTNEAPVIVEEEECVNNNNTDSSASSNKGPSSKQKVDTICSHLPLLLQLRKNQLPSMEVMNDFVTSSKHTETKVSADEVTDTKTKTSSMTPQINLEYYQKQLKDLQNDLKDIQERKRLVVDRYTQVVDRYNWSLYEISKLNDLRFVSDNTMEGNFPRGG